MRNYVIINDWAKDSKGGTSVLGVVHSWDEAKDIFIAKRKTERKFAKRNSYDIYEDSDSVFRAGLENHYDEYHVNLYIVLV